MKKFEIRDRALKTIYDVIRKDSRKMEFTNLEINKKGQSYYIKYGYTHGRNIFIIIKNTAYIEFYLRLRNDPTQIYIEYYNPKLLSINDIDNNFFVKMKQDFEDTIKTMIKSEDIY